MTHFREITEPLHTGGSFVSTSLGKRYEFEINGKKLIKTRKEIIKDHGIDPENKQLYLKGL